VQTVPRHGEHRCAGALLCDVLFAPRASPDALTLQVKWQGRTFTIVLAAGADVAQLKRQLADETNVQASVP
jgi:hypothetical protein